LALDSNSIIIPEHLTWLHGCNSVYLWLLLPSEYDNHITRSVPPAEIFSFRPFSPDCEIFQLSASDLHYT
jgi:hypothetical protein